MARLHKLWREYGSQFLIISGGVALILLVQSGLFVGAHPLVGQPAPDFKLPTLDGEQEVRLSDYSGNTAVVLDFWAVWCPPCRLSLPVFAEVAASYEGAPVAFHTINVGDDPGEAAAFLQDLGVDLAHLSDAYYEAAEAFQAHGLPQTVVIDQQGIVQAVFQGYAADGGAEIREALAPLLE